MSNAVSGALYISSLVLVGMYIFAAPGLIYLKNKRSISLGVWVVPVAAIAAWWGFFLGGMGAASPYNVMELIPLGIVFVVAVYVSAVIITIKKRAMPVGYFVLIGTFVGVIALRFLMPEVGE